MTITTIAVEKLKLSADNVRKSFTKSGIDEMKASILSHGLLDNLIVTEADDGMYDVVGGGRRLVAMQALIKEGSLPKGYSVPCKIVDAANAAELSLAENTVREAMHPADEFEAFAALAKDHAPAEIALRFGVTEAHVLKRLKLGRVAQEIMEAFRKDKLNLESMMAFTLTDDHAVQRKVYKAVKDNPNAHSIRRLLTDKKVGSRDKLARFVGLEAYENAGGKITGDLFKAEQYLDDPALLEELAAGKLKALEEKLKAEGWGWVHVSVQDEYGFTHKYGRIQAKQVQPPKELVQKHAKLTKECEKLESQLRDMDDDDPRYAELDAKSDEMVAQLEAVETEFDAYKKFTPEQMKDAGVYARLDYEGKLNIDRGLVSRATEKKLETAKTGKKVEPEEKGMSQSLRLSLEAFRLQAAEVALASKPELAYDLLVFNAATSLIADEYAKDGLDINFHDRTPIMGEVKDTTASKALAAMEEKLALKWIDLEDAPAQFEAFRKLSAAQKASILAYCVALTLKPNLAPDYDGIGAYDVTLALTGMDVATLWRPTAENYLSRITRDQLLDIGGGEIFSKSWAEKWGSAKKGDLVKELDRAFKDPTKFSGNKETEQKLRTWLPEGMAFTLPEKKAKAKKKAA